MLVEIVHWWPALICVGGLQDFKPILRDFKALNKPHFFQFDFFLDNSVFIFEASDKLGIHEEFKKWVRLPFSNASSIFNFDCSPREKYQMEKGLRQRCPPLPPLTFSIYQCNAPKTLYVNHKDGSHMIRVHKTWSGTPLIPLHLNLR